MPNPAVKVHFFHGVIMLGIGCENIKMSHNSAIYDECKLSQLRFWPCHENLLNKTIPAKGKRDTHIKVAKVSLQLSQ